MENVFPGILLHSIFLPKFRLNSSRFGNWTIFRFFESFPRKPSWHLNLFQTVLNFWLNTKRQILIVFCRCCCSCRYCYWTFLLFIVKILRAGLLESRAVNANAGLKGNRGPANFPSMKIFSTVYVLCSLAFVKLKTEG